MPHARPKHMLPTACIHTCKQKGLKSDISSTPCVAAFWPSLVETTRPKIADWMQNGGAMPPPSGRRAKRTRYSIRSFAAKYVPKLWTSENCHIASHLYGNDAYLLAEVQKNTPVGLKEGFFHFKDHLSQKNRLCEGVCMVPSKILVRVLVIEGKRNWCLWPSSIYHVYGIICTQPLLLCNIHRNVLENHTGGSHLPRGG